MRRGGGVLFCYGYYTWENEVGRCYFGRFAAGNWVLDLGKNYDSNN